jgi:hypothetical protein
MARIALRFISQMFDVELNVGLHVESLRKLKLISYFLLFLRFLGGLLSKIPCET